MQGAYLAAESPPLRVGVRVAPRKVPEVAVHDGLEGRALEEVLAALRAERLELEAEVLRAQAAPVRKSISELGARRWRDAPRRFDVCTGRRRMRAQSVRIGFS